MSKLAAAITKAQTSGIADLEQQLAEAKGKLDDLEGVRALADQLAMSLDRILKEGE